MRQPLTESESIITVWDDSRVVVKGTTLDYLFRPGCVKALRTAQKEDKLWRQVRERPEEFKDIGTRVGEYGDDLLRIDGRLVIPKTFT